MADTNNITNTESLAIEEMIEGVQVEMGRVFQQLPADMCMEDARLWLRVKLQNVTLDFL